MLVQSNGGKVYAILADNEFYELGVMPTLKIFSTSVFLSIRCRFKARQADVFNPMLVPKEVLVGGIERSTNTLRGTVMLHTGFTIEKVGSGFPQLMAEKLFAAAPGFLLKDDCALKEADLRAEDFVKDFSTLVLDAISPIYPASDFSNAPDLVTPFDLQVFMETASAEPTKPFSVVAGTDAGAKPNVTQFPLGGFPPADAPADVSPEDENA